MAQRVKLRAARRLPVANGRWRNGAAAPLVVVVAVPLLLGSGAALLLGPWPLFGPAGGAGWMGPGAARWHPGAARWHPGAARWQFVLGIGMACAVTALPILLLLDKLAILRLPLGQRILRDASLDDVLIWGVLALILLDWHRVGLQLVFLLGFAVASVLVRRLLRAAPDTDRWPVCLVWLALCAFGADVSGLHFMVGAFLAGAVIDTHWFDRARLDLLRHHVLLLMPVFFLSTGAAL